jgi:uncharacterized protein YkwD
MSIRTACALLTAAASFTIAGTARAADAADCPGALSEPSQTTLAATADTVTCLVNAERTRRGLRSVRRDGDLGRAARRQAADMVRRGYFAHVTPGGSTLGDRLRTAGYGAGEDWRAGEALGWGTGSRSTPGALVDEWLASPPHRRILLDQRHRELGVGVASGAPRDIKSGLAGATYALDFAVIR